METTVNERIAQIISQCRYKSKRSFAEKIGVAQTSLNDILRGAEPKYSTLYKILEAEPLISAEWLLRGEGDMIKPQHESELIPQPIKTSGNSESKYESESESINIDLQEEQIDSNRMIKKLIEALEIYQIRVDKLLDTVESLQNENAKLKSLLEKQKTR